MKISDAIQLLKKYLELKIVSENGIQKLTCDNPF